MWELIPPATAFAYFVGKHMGPVAQAYFLQMIETNAKVKEMRLLHAAAQDLNQQPAIAKVEGGQVSVLPREGGPPAQASSLIAEIRREPARFAELPEARALDRLVHQEETRQSNLEGVLETAFEEAMADPDFAPGERRVDERWGNRFVEAASEASDEGARALWGRVLAGELKSPGAFSLRTLDVLRNLSQSEANLFKRVAERRVVLSISPLAILSQDPHVPGHTSMLFRYPSNEGVEDDPYTLSFVERNALIAAGLIATEEGIWNVLTAEAESTVFIRFGESCTVATVPAGKKGDTGRTFPVQTFSVAGDELCDLVPMVDDRLLSLAILRYCQGGGRRVVYHGPNLGVASVRSPLAEPFPREQPADAEDEMPDEPATP